MSVKVVGRFVILVALDAIGIAADLVVELGRTPAVRVMAGGTLSLVVVCRSLMAAGAIGGTGYLMVEIGLLPGVRVVTG